MSRLVPLAEAAPQIRDGDLLLWRRRGIISIAGRGRHSHAAKAAWWDGDLFCLEMRELCGGRAVTLESQVAQYPGRIDWYETNPFDRWPHYDRAAATRAMRRKAGRRYSYRGLLRAAMLHLPLVRIFVKPELTDGGRHEAARPEFCSEACASADRMAGGVDPVPNLGDRITEPADLARSPFYHYRATLLPVLLAFACLLFGPSAAEAQPCPDGSCPPAYAAPTRPAHPGLVRLRHESSRGAAYGSGTIIDVANDQLLILSCGHLFDHGPGATSRTARDGRRHAVEAIAVDRAYDLSLLIGRLAPGEHFAEDSIVPIAQEHPSPGEPVRSCGFGPSGNYVCASGRVVGYARAGAASGFETLVVSGAARPGDSGGAIFDARGELAAVLWGTDGRRIVGTYCGRVRRFLEEARGRWQSRLRPRLPEKRPEAAPDPAAPPARTPAPPSPPQSLPDVGGAIVDRAPDLLLWALSIAGVSLSPWAVVGIRLAWRVHRRRRAKRGQSEATASSSHPSSIQAAQPPPRNDSYAEQLNGLMQSFGGRNTTQDATLGREYDRLLVEAETSSDATIARFAQAVRRRAREAFERIHADAPRPAV